MNYYGPKQRTKDGKWDYTRNNHPTGYCCEFREFDCEFVENFHISESEVAKHNQFASKYHTDGHISEEDACDCYKEYLLDHNLIFHKSENEQCKCRVCGEWTQHWAEIGCTAFHLCEQHRTRDEVAKLYNAPSWSMSSW